jgi:hypothetical protein
MSEEERKVERTERRKEEKTNQYGEMTEKEKSITS